MAPPTTPTDFPKEKTGPIGHVEDNMPGDLKSGEAVADAAAMGQATSGYEGLTPWQTIMTFKVATLVCFMAAFSAATDGYQIGSVE